MVQKRKMSNKNYGSKRKRGYQKAPSFPSTICNTTKITTKYTVYTTII